MTWVVGLTGGIGSGKSAVAEAFARLGIPVSDTDHLARELTMPGGPALAPIIAAFGHGYRQADGTLDRARLREHVFADAAKRAKLESILHPLIGAAARRDIADWTGPYGVLVVPLLFERGGLRDLMQRILVVDCPEDEQIRRAMERSGLRAAEVQSIMATQLPRNERLARADDVLDNAGPLSEIPRKVEVLNRRYRALAAPDS